jgi:hypothetical protein
MLDKLVTVARFTDNIEAELAKQSLEDFGITCVITGQTTGAVFSGVPAALDIELQVPESMAEEARNVLQSDREQE